MVYDFRAKTLFLNPSKISFLPFAGFKSLHAFGCHLMKQPVFKVFSFFSNDLIIIS